LSKQLPCADHSLLPAKPEKHVAAYISLLSVEFSPRDQNVIIHDAFQILEKFPFILTRSEGKAVLENVIKLAETSAAAHFKHTFEVAEWK
jgi:hypothetical protein